MANHGHVIYGNNKGEPKAPKVSRPSMGSDRSIDQSPLHQPSKISGRGSGGISSPSWDQKPPSEGSHKRAHSTPGRSRPSSIPRGDDTLDDSPAVPKFGDWDENDPNSGQGFTQIFQSVRDEKLSGTGKVPNSADASSHNGHKLYGKKSSKVCGCFPWAGK